MCLMSHVPRYLDVPEQVRRQKAEFHDALASHRAIRAWSVIQHRPSARAPIAPAKADSQLRERRDFAMSPLSSGCSEKQKRCSANPNAIAVITDSNQPPNTPSKQQRTLNQWKSRASYGPAVRLSESSTESRYRSPLSAETIMTKRTCSQRVQSVVGILHKSKTVRTT